MDPIGYVSGLNEWTNDVDMCVCVSVFVVFLSLLWQPWFLHTFTYSLKTNAKNYQVQHLKLLFVPALEVAIVLAIAASEKPHQKLGWIAVAIVPHGCSQKIWKQYTKPIGFSNIVAFQKDGTCNSFDTTSTSKVSTVPRVEQLMHLQFFQSKFLDLPSL